MKLVFFFYKYEFLYDLYICYMSSLINCSIVKLENLYLHLIFLFVCKRYRYDATI